VSDLLEIPNLYGEGQQYLQYFGRRYVLGENVRSSLRWSPRDIFTRIYGLCAFLWRILICVSLMLAACMLFHGLGIILAVAGFALWVGVPMVRLIRHVRHHDGLHRQRQARLAIAVLTGFGLICVCSGLGWPGAKSAPVIVQYEPLAYVRASSPGFVREIHVVSGQYVSAGEPIARLENRELCAELPDLRLAIQQSRGKLRVFKQSDEMHSYQAELERVRSLKEKLQQKQEQIDDLILRAPSPGRVIARNLPSAIDTFLQQGDHLAAIGDESKKELQISISQPDFHHFEAQLARPLSIRLSGGTVMTGVLEHVDPRATNRAPHETMYASLGGPMQNRKLSSEQESEQFELASEVSFGLGEAGKRSAGFSVVHYAKRFLATCTGSKT
jgi:putative peptide zinc metalloprotease protein